MAEFWTSYGWPTTLIVMHSVAMMVVLLVFIAFILLADRKIWAAVQMRRGPNVVGPFCQNLKNKRKEVMVVNYKSPEIYGLFGTLNQNQTT